MFAELNHRSVRDQRGTDRGDRRQDVAAQLRRGQQQGGDLPNRARWTKLTAIGMTFNQTTRHGKQTVEVRYDILSKKLTARRFAVTGASRTNGIGNLDVTFPEDQSRLREGHAATNFSLLRRAALSLLKNDHTQKLGVKNKRLKAAWDDNYLLQVLFNS